MEHKSQAAACARSIAEQDLLLLRQGRRLHPNQVLKNRPCIVLFILTRTNIYPFFLPLREGGK